MQVPKPTSKKTKSKRTKALDFSPKVREKIKARDADGGTPRCIFCGSAQMLQIAHVVNKSQGGMGIEENGVVACIKCHERMDNGKGGEIMRELACEYLKSKYPMWCKEDLVYSKIDPAWLFDRRK